MWMFCFSSFTYPFNPYHFSFIISLQFRKMGKKKKFCLTRIVNCHCCPLEGGVQLQLFHARQKTAQSRGGGGCLHEHHRGGRSSLQRELF